MTNQSQNKIAFELKAKELGPLADLSCKLDFTSLKTAVYTNNGSGKTFLSRVFRLTNKNEGIANNLIGLHSNSTNFELNIQGSQGAKKLTVNIQRDQIPVISNQTGYIFHVFNSDYVKENIEEKRYTPDNNIEGYILGKEKIDISREKNTLSELDVKIEKEKEEIAKKINESKEKLDELGIHKGINEYKQLNSLTPDKIIEEENTIQEEKSFSQLKSERAVLQLLPENLADVNYFVAPGESQQLLGEVKEVLKTKYSKSQTTEDFKRKIDSKKEFIEKGTALHEESENKSHCPYCEQELNTNAKSLIDEYVAYLKDEESKIKNRIKRISKSLKDLKEHVVSNYKEYFKTKNEFENLRKYIPSEAQTELHEAEDPKNLSLAIDKLIELLDKKSLDIELEINSTEYDSNCEIIKKYHQDYTNEMGKNNHLVIAINEKKNNITAEKLSINKRICNACQKELRNNLASKVIEIKTLQKERDDLIIDIKQKEEKERTDKKEKVAATLTNLLKNFFGDKYEFNKDDFSIRFLKTNINDKLSDVLSEGEKTIVAFCYYIADTYKIIENEDDYQKLFFVIDDPISSLDFHYVYSVAQIIKDIGQMFSIQRSRFIVLTHNIEFMSILIRNKVVDNRLVLYKGGISTMKKEVVLPYHEHLKDLYAITNGGSPSHTTANSIRHVLETINRFESPNLELKDFIQSVPEFTNTTFLQALMHDMSHGAYRNHLACTEDDIKRGCSAVISFIQGKYNGQLVQMN